MSQQLANSAALRTQQKKILLLEGALHRLALVESVANLKAGVRANSLFGLIEPAIKRRLLLDTVLPVFLSMLPMLAGSARLPRLLRRILVAASVGAIDGVPVPLPASKAGIEASVQRLDEAGLAAVAAGLQPEPAFDKALAGN